MGADGIRASGDVRSQRAGERPPSLCFTRAAARSVPAQVSDFTEWAPALTDGIKGRVSNLLTSSQPGKQLARVGNVAQPVGLDDRRGRQAQRRAD